MRIDAKKLERYQRAPAPPPAPVEPLLTPAEEAKLLSGRDPGSSEFKARRARARRLMLNVAVPRGDDAALLVLLAAKKALPIDDYRDRLSAIQRLVDIGNLADPPPEVAEVMRRKGVASRDGAGLADALLPEDSDLSSFGEHMPAGAQPTWGGGHSV